MWSLDLRENNLPFVCIDEPQGFKSSIPPTAQTTSDMALVRFHGRNRFTWEKQGITTAERFNYLCSENELKEWVPRGSGAWPRKRSNATFSSTTATKTRQ
jgi:uncharacterized protein YecE (DUF72 family)